MYLYCIVILVFVLLDCVLNLISFWIIKFWGNVRNIKFLEFIGFWVCESFMIFDIFKIYLKNIFLFKRVFVGL